MSVDAVISIAWDVLKWVVVPIKRRVGYVISSKSYAQDLKQEAGTLEGEVERVQPMVEEAENNRRNIYRHVSEWLASAERALKDAEHLRGFENVSKTCCYGTLPDPIIRYRFSRKAKETIDDIQKLALKCKEFKQMNDISSSGPAPGKVTALTPVVRARKDVAQSTPAMASASSSSTSIKLEDYGIFESRALMVRDIMDALADNNNMVVGVHGMGGVGKSTLLVDAERIIREKGSFDWVAKADVSENPDTKRIQGEIAHWLGLSDIKKEENVSLRADLLRERLEDEERKKKKVLIILDNLWERLDLKLVGIPCGHNNKVTGCKLLLTARDQLVLRREMRCDKDFLLGRLKEEESKALFQTMVGGKVPVEFEFLLDEALRISAGLPFLILAIAKLFIDTSISECRDALKEVGNEEIGDVINKTLQLSYDHIKSKDAKSLLRLIAIYGVSEPSFETLMKYGVGLGLFGEDRSMEDARGRLSSLIHTLRASSLLLDSGEDGFKIHDLVRGFVSSVASRDDPFLLLKDNIKSIAQLPEDKLKSCTALCFPYVGTKELPEQLDCPELRIFLLFSNNIFLKVPDSLFGSLGKLMVLNLNGIHLTCSPSSFRSLEKLHTLCLDQCSVRDIAILGELKSLRILSFVRSHIQRLPKEISQLTELRMLDLTNCSLPEIEPGVLASLTKLEELYMWGSFDEWNAVDLTPATNASLIELNNMEKLCTLHLSIPNPSVLPTNFNMEKLTKYKIRIGSKWRDWSYKGSRALGLVFDGTSNTLQKGCIRTALHETDDLFLGDLNGIEQSIAELSAEGFSKVKYLNVGYSPSIHYILQQPSLTAFQMLESLLLENLINLEKICNSHISSGSFGALKVVQVKSCAKIEFLFPLSLVKELPQLEEIRVSECDLMREIIKADGCGKVELRNLHVLELGDLLLIQNFCTVRTAPSSSMSKDQVGTQAAFFNGQQDAFPNLETLQIVAMGYIERIWDNPVCFGHLKTLHVSCCDKLSHIFTSTVVGNFMELTRLTIDRCNILTEVIVDEGGEETCIVAFKKLKYLELRILTRLRCFNLGGHALMFPVLEDVIVIECLNMKFFSNGPIEAPKLGKIRLTNNDMVWKENLNTSIKYIFEEMAIAGVDKLWISEFPELIEKWHSKLIPIKSSWELRSLVMDNCPSFVYAIPSRLMLVLENISKLHVCNSELLNGIFDLEGLEGKGSTPVLPSLWSLCLVNLPKLRQLWNNDLQGRLCFNKLRILKLYKCGNLKHVFTPSMARSFVTLRLMEIRECGHMECVIFEEKGQGSAMKKITFLDLWEMTLERLPELTSFLSGKNHTLEFRKLMHLTITHCPKMRSFMGQSSTEIDRATPSLFPTQVQFPVLNQLIVSHMDSLSNIWTNGLPETHISKDLWKVKVQNCKSLEYLFPYWLANSLNKLRELQMESCELMEIIMSKDDTPRFTTAQVLFSKLTFLVLHEMPKLKSFCPNLSTSNLSSLQELQVTHCHELQISSSVALMNKWTQRDEEQDLPNQKAHSSIEWDCPKLVKLQLDRDDIKRIQDGSLADDIYGKPIGLTLACFHDENDIFPSRSLLERFHNLRSLEIFCSSFEDIFPDDEPIEQREYPVLEKLNELKLSKLRNLNRVWREDCLISKIFRSIETFEVWDCPGLTTLFPTVTSFQHLTRLVVQNCSGLIHLLTVSEDTNLVHLIQMTIIGCERMKEVIVNDGNREGKVISFKSLSTLTLQNLPSLVCFSSDTSCVCKFPSLHYIEVEECPKMKIFSRGVLSTPNLRRFSLFRYRCDMWEKGDPDLNTVIQKLSA